MDLRDWTPQPGEEVRLHDGRLGTVVRSVGGGDFIVNRHGKAGPLAVGQRDMQPLDPKRALPLAEQRALAEKKPEPEPDAQPATKGMPPIAPGPVDPPRPIITKEADEVVQG